MKKYTFFLIICVVILSSCHLNTNNKETNQTKETELNYINAPMGRIEEDKVVLSEESVNNQEDFSLYEITEKDINESKVTDMIRHDITGDEAEEGFPLYGKEEVYLSKIPVVVYNIELKSVASYYNYFVFDNEINVDNGITVNMEINNRGPGKGVCISDCIDDLFADNVLKKTDEEYVCLSDGRGLALLDKNNNIITDNKKVDIEVEGDCFIKLKNMGLSVKGSDILNDNNLIKIEID